MTWNLCWPLRGESTAHWWSPFTKDQGGYFKNTYELLNPRALKISMLYKIVSFNVWVSYVVWNFKGSLWNSTQNILSIQWKMCILFTGENSRALRFKSSKAFLKCPPGPCLTTVIWGCHKKFSQWEHSFLWKLCCHWLKGVWQRQITIVRQGIVMQSFDVLISLAWTRC